jgi:hypothetical protein
MRSPVFRLLASQSKNAFAIIMLLFLIADTGVKGSAPCRHYPGQSVSAVVQENAHEDPTRLV